MDAAANYNDCRKNSEENIAVGTLPISFTLLADEFNKKISLNTSVSDCATSTNSSKLPLCLREFGQLSTHMQCLLATILGDDSDNSSLKPLHQSLSATAEQFDGRLRRRNLTDTDLTTLTWILRASTVRVRTGAVFSRLTELDLSRNRLTTLPDGLCRALPSLTKLNLAHNRIVQCPSSLSHLTGLQELNLTGNRLGTEDDPLPGWLFRRWPQLRVLRLSDNFLENLPNELAQLKQLEVLELGSVLGGNRLKHLPTGCLVHLRNLADLDLTGNQITKLEFTDNFYGYTGSSTSEGNDSAATVLPNLSYLTLTDNHLCVLPVELAECSQLRSLRADGNRLTSLPTELVDLANLELLDVARNQLSIWPAELDELARRGCTVILAQNPFDKQTDLLQSRRNSVITISEDLSTSTSLHSNDAMLSNQTYFNSPLLQSKTPTTAGSVPLMELDTSPILPAIAFESARPITAHATVASNNNSNIYYNNSNNTKVANTIANGPPSLLELSARALLRHQQPIPYHALPDHLVTYLSGGAHACARCYGPFVGEWFGGHGVHRWLRYSAIKEASRIAFTTMSKSSKHHQRIVTHPASSLSRQRIKDAFIFGRCLRRNLNGENYATACARWRYSAGEDDDTISVASSGYDGYSTRDRWCDPTAIDTEAASSSEAAAIPSSSTAPYSPLSIFMHRLRCDVSQLDW
ncbi:hypothetical protein BDF19DRAFT_444651 [Syncephalis fuscata]|nr:hypothetical protein BDF19DRAFT_444651 [Syncephalis fuscata]